MSQEKTCRQTLPGRGAPNTIREKHSGHGGVSEGPGNALLEGDSVEGESCLLVSSKSYKSDIAQWLSSHPHSGVWLFFFTFNLHHKLERNELHPPGFLCSIQLRKAIS